MAQYFFDMSNGNAFVEDKVGRDLDDIPAARECAVALAADRVFQSQEWIDPHDTRELQVREADGRYVAKVAFRYLSLQHI